MLALLSREPKSEDSTLELEFSTSTTQKGTHKFILSFNDLKGAIPTSLTEIPMLLLVDLSINTLTSKITVFKPVVKVFVDGNKSEQPSHGAGGSKGDHCFHFILNTPFFHLHWDLYML
jgi:hypothetical protein